MSDIYSPYFAPAAIKCYGIENCPQNYDIITDIYRIEREVDEWQDLADFIPNPAL